MPARLDRLPWGRFHSLVAVALGITWLLDGLEVTLAGSVAGALRDSRTLHFSAGDIGFANSAYLAGAVLGSLFFGWLTDRLGRKRLFSVTLLLYLTATAATALTWSLPGFALCRFLTGAGIGGEYSAINSAIQELIPARFRGRTDLAINGSFWIGAALGGAEAIVLLNPAFVPVALGWRAAFLGGAAIGLVILFMRRHIPESPRWLMIHGRHEEAAATVGEIEARFRAEGHTLPPAGKAENAVAGRQAGLKDIFRALIRLYPARTAYGLGLMIAQAFFYNAIFFTYAMVLTDFYGVKEDRVGWYVLPFALGNVAGPLLLGPLFDTVGRRRMIALTYGLSGLLLAGTGALFVSHALTALTQTLCWSGTFFFASAAASSAYLTVAESFPLEIRAIAIALFYAFGTGLGGVAAPWFFGVLIQSGSRVAVLAGYLIAAGLMAGASLLAIFIGLDNEGKSLEAIARPLSWDHQEAGEPPKA